MDDYEPEYIPFTGPPTPEVKKKKKEKPEKEKREERPPKKKKEKMKKIIPEEIKIYTWQLEKFQIMMADSKNILVALMLDSAPSEPIREALLKFTSQFEGKFQTEIEGFRGNISWFKPATEIADDSFNMFLMRPQCLPLTEHELKKINFTDTETKIVRIAQDVSKETGYFFLATLLDELLKRFRIPQEKILRSFFSLNRKKAFLPIHIEDVGIESEKRRLWQTIACIEGLTQEECNLIMDDLILSNEESRNVLINRLLNFKKKKRGVLLREEITKRKQTRKGRDECFKQVDELLKLNDYNEVIKAFDKIIQLSAELGEESVAQELTKRSQIYREELTQMVQQIPVLRSQRNEALNQAELLELDGKYVEAAKQFDKASQLSVEIGEINKAKEYLNQSQRLISLSELSKLREKLK